jgi:hypothetical protein
MAKSKTKAAVVLKIDESREENARLMQKAAEAEVRMRSSAHPAVAGRTAL